MHPYLPQILPGEAIYNVGGVGGGFGQIRVPEQSGLCIPLSSENEHPCSGAQQCWRVGWVARTVSNDYISMYVYSTQTLEINFSFTMEEKFRPDETGVSSCGH